MTIPCQVEKEQQVAVLIPCHNEERTIRKVVLDFKKVLPDATIYVYENACDDNTVEAASGAGAVVCSEPLKGKGNVVRRMFADVEADIYVLVDGDDTYNAHACTRMIRLLYVENLDMVSAARVSECYSAYRRGHILGNRAFTGLIAIFFGKRFEDVFSGYRVFSRRFVKSFVPRSDGFEIETELTVHALQLKIPVAEVHAPYGSRPAGSSSKLSTIRDGFRILKMLLVLLKNERPFEFFTALSWIFGLASLALAYPVVTTYLETGLVPRIPTAFLSATAMVIAALSFVSGIILDTVTMGRKEAKRLAYLTMPGLGKRLQRPRADYDMECINGQEALAND